MHNSVYEFRNNRKKLLGEQLNYWRFNLRSGILRLLERVIFRFNVSDILGGDLGQISHLTEVRNQIVKRELLTPALPPRNLPSNIDKYFESTVPQYLLNLSNVKVDILTGLAILEAGFVVDSTLSKWQKTIYRGGIGSAIRRAKRSRNVIPEKSVVMPHTPFYFHALIDELPNLLKARNNDPDLKTVVVHEISPRWMVELLQAVHFEVKVTKEPAMKFSDFIAVTAPRAINRENLQLLRGIVPQSMEEILIVSRSGAPRSDSVLEKALELSIPGSRFIDPGKLSVEGQIAAFSRARAIIGLHGGALTNLVWMSEFGKVVEIFNHSYRTSDYENLCHEIGQSYLAIDYSSQDPSEIANQIQKFINE